MKATSILCTSMLSHMSEVAFCISHEAKPYNYLLSSPNFLAVLKAEYVNISCIQG